MNVRLSRDASKAVVTERPRPPVYAMHKYRVVADERADSVALGKHADPAWTGLTLEHAVSRYFQNGFLTRETAEQPQRVADHLGKLGCTVLDATDTDDTDRGVIL